MTNVFLVSDTHFGHAATVERFKRHDDPCTPLRPFQSVEDMDEQMVDLWNDTVGENDRVYHLGDVVMNARHLHIMGRLKGRKVLIQGNHDPIGGKSGRKFDFTPYFEYICGMKVLSDLILTHIPVHESQIGRFGANVHGHLHDKQVMRDVDAGHPVRGMTSRVPDPRYLCVSVEHTDFKPISLEDVKARIQKRQFEAGYEAPTAWGNGSGPS